MRIRLPGHVTKVYGSGSERRTLAKVFLYLDSITVDRYLLTWDQGTLVAGLLEGHSTCAVFTLRKPQPTSLFRNLACHPRGVSEP